MKFTGERFIPGQVFGEIEVEHWQRYLSVLDIVEDKVVLDAACGEGYGSSLLAEHAKESYGIDISHEAINWAKEHYERENLHFSQASIESLPFSDHSIDVVVSFETIEHVDESAQKQFLQEIKRVLKKDGLLVMSTPDKRIYSDIPKYTNIHHVKEFYYDEYKFFVNNYFSHVVMFDQGYETLSVLSPSPNQGVHNSRYSLIDFHQKLNKNRRYIVAVCSDHGLDAIDTLQNCVLLEQPGQEFISKLYVNYGSGYSEDIVMYSNANFLGDDFTVEFPNLDQTNGEIRGLRWQAVHLPLHNVRVDDVSTNGPKIELEPLGLWRKVAGYDVFETLHPIYELNGDLKNVSSIRFRGEIKFLKDQEIFSLMSDRLQEVSVAFAHTSVRLEEVSAALANTSERHEEVLVANASLEELVMELKRDKELMLSSQNKTSSEKELLEQQVHSLACEREHLVQLANRNQAQLLEVLGSTSWKYTRPLRWLGRRMRNIKRET